MKYNDKVRVTSGFYEGMEGTIKDYTYSDSWTLYWEPINPYTKYSILLTDWNISKYINESDLELIK